MNINETRNRLFKEANYTCEVCKNWISEWGTPQLGHRIPQSKMYIKKYGKEIIHHESNMAVTCSLACNAKVSINGKNKLIENLVKKIRYTIDINE